MVMYIPPATTLRTKAIQKLMFEPAVDSSTIQVSCKNGTIILSGSVNSFFEKNITEQAVKSIEGVKEVQNELQVNLAAEYRRTDKEIIHAAKNALKWDVAVPEERIEVSVENGEVTLTGNVDWWYQKNNAERAIRNLIGIKNINNLISILPAPSAEDIKKKIAREFHRNATIDAEKIHIEISGNKVILKGSVRSWPEMKEATRAALSVPGVTEIENHLVIRD
jgi:osmotically-inducible protein OsmY